MGDRRVKTYYKHPPATHIDASSLYRDFRWNLLHHNILLSSTEFDAPPEVMIQWHLRSDGEITELMLVSQIKKMRKPAAAALFAWLKTETDGLAKHPFLQKKPRKVLFQFACLPRQTLDGLKKDQSLANFFESEVQHIDPEHVFAKILSQI